jgi:hypothetical protein
MKQAKLTTIGTIVGFLLLFGIGAAPAQAVFGLSDFAVTYETSAGAPAYEAGAHANMKTVFHLDAPGGKLQEAMKDFETDLPAGFYGDPTVAPSCNVEELVRREGFCSVAAQVGYLYVEVEPDFPSPIITTAPVYKLPTASSQTAMLGAMVLGAFVRIEVSVRTDGDYGLTAKVPRTNQGVNVYGTELVLWGAPADPANDPMRFSEFATGGASAGAAPRPFLSLPARCEPVLTTARTNSWQHPDKWVEATSVTPPLSGCDDLVFEPKLDVRPQEARANVPTGLDVDLTIPQDRSVTGRATPQLRKAAVTLPRGMTISPGSADGLGACSDAQLAIGTNDEPSCPSSSKLGTVKVETPVLEEDLTGNLYLGEPQPGNLFRLAMVLHGPGILVKIPGVAKPDPATGQITTSFDDTPQLPFEHLQMQFKGGPRAPISTPGCGTHTTHAELTSWSSSVPVVSNSSFTIDQGCEEAGRFTPGLEAGTTDPAAGAFSPLVFRVIARPGQQNLASVQATLPEGVLAKLAGVEICPDAAADSGSCPASSQVGVTTVAAGPGSNPIYVPQPGKAPTAVYLAGPYRGQPYSLVVKVPAQAGPFDLGTVTVRNAVEIDPVTTQVTTRSNPLPQILEGVPVTYRDVRVELNRPDFTLNPTSCDQMAVTSVLTSIAGAKADPADRFRAVDCERLSFKPKLAIVLSGETHRSAHPRLRATLTMPKRGANLARAAVTLPKTEFLENAHIRTVCTRVQYAAEACPAGSVYGFAKAWTPLLDKPLQGPVYLRSSSHELPDLVASLDGQIHVDLQGRIDSVGARIRNTFDLVPDAPVSKFVLTMQGGRKGLLVNNAQLCRAKPRADVRFDGQNGRSLSLHPLVKADCAKARTPKRSG